MSLRFPELFPHQPLRQSQELALLCYQQPSLPQSAGSAPSPVPAAGSESVFHRNSLLTRIFSNNHLLQTCRRKEGTLFFAISGKYSLIVPWTVCGCKVWMGFLWNLYKKFAGMAKKPPLSGEVARRNAETERLQQICDDLSVTFGDSVPTPFVPSGHFPLIGGIGP